MSVATKPGLLVTYLEGLLPVMSRMALGSRDRPRSFYPSHIHYHSVYGYQSCHDGELP